VRLPEESKECRIPSLTPVLKRGAPGKRKLEGTFREKMTLNLNEIGRGMGLDDECSVAKAAIRPGFQSSIKRRPLRTYGEREMPRRVE